MLSIVGGEAQVQRPRRLVLGFAHRAPNRLVEDAHVRSSNILGGLLAAGLLMMGCGGVEPAMEEEQSSLDTREDALPFCGNQSYWIDYYSDATLTNWVGYISCTCNRTARISGRQTSFAVTDFSTTCG